MKVYDQSEAFELPFSLLQPAGAYLRDHQNNKC